MCYSVREMTMDDYDEVLRLWEGTEGLQLDESDSQNAIAIYLRRNPHLCFVAMHSEEIVGSILCGQDGRRGIVRHLAVKLAYRGKGISRMLVKASLSGLAKQNITKCNTFVLDENVEARRFWHRMGWYTLENNYRTLQVLTAQHEK